MQQAVPGDSIVVDSGTYREAVMITKRLALVGRHATIDARGQGAPPNGVRIFGAAAAGSSVSGFTIRNAGLEGIFAVRTSNVTIENDSLFGNDAYGTSNPLCAHHQSDCGETIHLQTVHDATVRGNFMRGNLGGILLTDEDGPTHDNTIADNTIIDNPKDCGITLASHWSDSTSKAPVKPGVGGVYRNTVAHNTITGAGGVGIGIFAAFPGGAAWGNVVEGNTVSKSQLAGLGIHAHGRWENVDGNVFRNNTVFSNATDVENPLDKVPAGISIASIVVPVHNTVITGNTIRDEGVGIITLNADPIPDLATNKIGQGVKTPLSIH